MAASLIVFGVVYARRRFMTNYGDAGNFQVPRFLGGLFDNQYFNFPPESYFAQNAIFQFTTAIP